MIDYTLSRILLLLPPDRATSIVRSLAHHGFRIQLVSDWQSWQVEITSLPSPDASIIGSEMLSGDAIHLIRSLHLSQMLVPSGLLIQRTERETVDAACQLARLGVRPLFIDEKLPHAVRDLVNSDFIQAIGYGHIEVRQRIRQVDRIAARPALEERLLYRILGCVPRLKDAKREAAEARVVRTHSVVERLVWR